MIARGALLAWLGTVLGLALAADLPLYADRLHLEGGGSIDTPHWWIEEDRLMYETGVGTVGLPRAMVVRIESVATPPSTPRSEDDGAGTPRPAREPGTSEIRVDTPLGRLLQDARAALDGRDYETAATLYERALAEADPDLQLPRIGYALSQMALGNDRRALSVVLDGLARDPREPSLLELQGDLYDREELVPDALRAWEEAFRQTPGDRLREKILKAERELEAARYYSFSKSTHFNLRYDRQLDASLARAVTDFLEQRFWQLADALRHTPGQPITVLLYPSEEFRDVTQAPEWVGGMYDGKIRVPLGGLRRLDPDAEGVLLHELTHAVVHSKSRGHCPRWLHEGLAQRFEGRALSEAGALHVRERLAAGEATDWAARDFSYPAALSFTQWLEARRGLDGLARVLELLGEGRQVDESLAEVYGASFATLCDKWARDWQAGG